ncbi:8352_t:CDS:2, partial [Funneliformis caledonium]
LGSSGRSETSGTFEDSEVNFGEFFTDGIDFLSLDLLCKNEILTLKRAKRRNMERLQLICEGIAQNSVNDLSSEILRYTGLIYEHTLEKEKYTFVEEVKNSKSVIILVKRPNSHIIAQINDAIRDRL